jgi:adenylate cyclase
MTEAGTSSGWAERLKRSLRQIGPVRLLGTALFLLLGLLCARYAWQLPLASDAERALYDIRFVTAAERIEQDERIVLVTYNDDTLEALAKRSPLDRKLLADALTALDSLGPKAIGIDILFDQAQPEDPQLIGALRRMRTPTYIAFATSAANGEQMLYWQEQFLRDFLRRASGGAVRPASIRLVEEDADGVIRRWPDRPEGLPPLLPNALTPERTAFRDYMGSIDFRLPAADDRGVFTELPIDFVTAAPDAVREFVRGRYVLIGGNIKDVDDFETPMTRATQRWTKGIEIHAQLLAQALDGRLRRAVPGAWLWVVAVVAVLAGAFTSLMELRSWKLILALALQLGAIGAFPFLLQHLGADTYGLPAFGSAVGWAFAFAAVGTAARAVGSEQRRFAQATLGKYLPADVAAEILKDPDRLTLRGEKKRIYALFSDLEGFTKLSHAITPEQLSSLLNRYLDVLSETVLGHGGTIDKFVGDAVVAFWGAPIAREDDADRAVRAAVAMFEAGEEFRRSVGAELPPIGCTRVGLHYGEAVIGNFGGEGRIQYTALGDGMNTAARLESANKQIRSTILVSDEAKAQSTLDIFRPLGRVVLSGRATPVELWEPVPHMPEERRRELNDLWLAFDGGDPKALDAMERLAAAGEDAALEAFVYRLREAGPGGHFVLGSK